MTNVAVVITTFNRLEKLKIALNAYKNQILLPKIIVVVNNNSTDGTKAFLEEWEKISDGFSKTVINLDENLGGSGGFYEGQKYVMQLEDIDWILIADDDAYPDKNYISGLANYITDNPNSNLSVVCGRVIEPDKVVNNHRTYLKSKWNRYFQLNIPSNDYNKKILHPDFVSYVGVLIHKDKLKQVGLVNKDYFIWYDDTEHSQRLKQVGDIVCIPEYTIIHDVAEENAGLNWKNYYGFRNNVDFFKKHFKLQMPFVVAVTIAKALLCPLKGKSFAEVKLRLTAIKDGLLGNLGKHPVYKPGWKP